MRYVGNLTKKKKIKYQRFIRDLFSLLATGQELKIKTHFWIRTLNQLLSVSFFLFYLWLVLIHAVPPGKLPPVA